MGLRPFILAAVAVGLAAVGALGPAERDRATYEWPPAALPAGATPASRWYSPLLLSRQVPAELRAVIPCGDLAPALAEADRPTTVIATARDPRAFGGLEVVRSGGTLRLAVGDREFASVRLDECDELELRIEGARWHVSAEASGDLPERPVVTGLFSGLDLAAGAAPRISVTTEPFAVSGHWWQNLAWLLAAAAALAALVLVAARPRIRPWSTRRLVGSLRPVDAAVAVVLLAWWIVAPTMFDDGWVKARATNYEALGAFSSYYSAYGSTLAVSYWLEWLQRWPIASFDSLLAARLPALLALAAVWGLCRWALPRVVGRERLPGGAEWALALTFLVFAMAWAMTLRPEPVLALLAVAVLVCAVLFVERPGAAPLAVAAPLVVLAVAAHPIGLTALAPLLAIAPHVWTWARLVGWAVPATIVLGAGALFLVLATVDSDLAQRAEEARLARTFPQAAVSWREELSRYLMAGTPVRRMSIALMLAAVLAFLLRPERRSRPLIDLPATSVALGMLLLVPSPSKWPWHFGAVMGLAALAVAAEVVRLRESRSPLRPLVAAAVAVLVVAWSWSPRGSWAALDLRTLDWTLDLERYVTLVKVAAALLVVAFVVALLRGGRSGVRTAAERLVPWLVPLAAVPAIAFTVAVLVADAIETPGWTAARQNLDSLLARGGCGLADDTVVADPASMLPVGPVPTPPPSPWVEEAPVEELPVYTILDPAARAEVETPWFDAPRAGRRVGFYAPAELASGESVEARWGTRRGEGVEALEWRGVAVPGSAGGGSVPWTFVPQSALPERPAGADAFQLRLSSVARPPRASSITGAVSYRPVTLSTLFEAERPLVWPNVLMFTPCAELPRLADGLVEPPGLLVAHSGLWPIEYDSSPFHGLLDLYRLRDLSVGDSPLPPHGVTTLWLERPIPGGTVAPVERAGA